MLFFSFIIFILTFSFYSFIYPSSTPSFTFLFRFFLFLILVLILSIFFSPFYHIFQSTCDHCYYFCLFLRTCPFPSLPPYSSSLLFTSFQNSLINFNPFSSIHPPQLSPIFCFPFSIRSSSSTLFLLPFQPSFSFFYISSFTGRGAFIFLVQGTLKEKLINTGAWKHIASCGGDGGEGGGVGDGGSLLLVE